MSMHFEIKEHLIVKEIEDVDYVTEKNDIVDFVRGELAILACLMLTDIAEIHDSKFVIDGEEVNFSGLCPNEKLKEIIVKLEKCREFEMVSHYSFWEYGMHAISQMAGPWDLQTYLDGLNEQQLEGVFYSMWNNADCNPGEGLLVAYGNHNGNYYHGEVEFEERSNFSEGNWYAWEDCVFDVENLSKEDFQKALTFCREMSTLESVGSEIGTGEGSISYYMINVELRTTEQFEMLTRDYEELCKISSETMRLGEYLDSSGDDVRLMHIDYDDENNQIIKIAEIK